LALLLLLVAVYSALFRGVKIITFKIKYASKNYLDVNVKDGDFSADFSATINAGIGDLAFAKRLYTDNIDLIKVLDKIFNLDHSPTLTLEGEIGEPRAFYEHHWSINSINRVVDFEVSESSAFAENRARVMVALIDMGLYEPTKTDIRMMASMVERGVLKRDENGNVSVND
jgi:hypothetical protein